MKIINRKAKLLNKNKKTKPFFNNILLNQLNWKISRKNSFNISNSINNIQNYENNKKTNNNYSEIEKQNNEYKKSKSFTLYFKNSFKKYKLNTSISLNNNNNSNLLFEKFLLGNDIILPLRTLNDCDISNKPYYILNNYNKLNSLSPIKKRRNIKMKGNNNSLNSPIYLYNLNNITSYKKSKINKYNKKNLLNISDSNKNFNFHLYDSISTNNFSNKHKDSIQFITQDELNQLKKNSSIFKSAKRINSFNLNNNHKKSQNISKIYNYLNNNNCKEINKNQEKRIRKEMDDKINQLIDNPSSFVYIMFNKLKKSKLNELPISPKLYLKRGDAKIIKNAGGLVISAFDSAMRSLIVAIYELGVQEIMVVAHSHCGACHMSYDHFHHEMIARGVTDETLDTIRKCGIDLDQWLEGFKDTPTSVRKTVETIKTHPLVPKDMVVRGFIIDSETGALEEID